MSDASDHINKTLDELKTQFTTKMNEAKKILAAINMLEEMLGSTKTALPEFPMGASIQGAGSIGDSTLVGVASAKSVINGIRPDEYLGEPPLEAAKKFLRRVNVATRFDEIAEAVQKGGAATVGDGWKKKLEASLLRSTRDVVKVQEGIYGLTGFYSPEQLKGLRETRRQRPKNEGKKHKRGRPKKRTSRTKISAAEKKTIPSISPAPEPIPKKRGRPPKRQDQEAKEGKEEAAYKK